MKIKGLIFSIAFAAMPAASHARTWFVEVVQDASCQILPWNGISSPYDAEDIMRNQGSVPSITETNNPDGSLATVTLTEDQGQNNSTQIEFFTSMDGCQDQLDQDIKDGVVTDPNSLK